MDYEKKYKEALEKARQLCVYPTTKPFISDLQDLFPELKEPEDEKIRKALINGFNKLDKSALWYNGTTNGQILAWLEKQGENFTKKDVDGAYLKGLCDAKHELGKQGGQKPIISNDALREGIAHFGITQYQIDNWLKKYVDIETQGEQNLIMAKSPQLGEQKPANKVEPKFKVGDKIRKKTPSSCDKDMQVARIEKDYYICNHIGKFSSEPVPFSKESSYELIEQKPAWSEEDEERLQSCLNILQAKGLMGVTDTVNSKWLKALKDRVQPKQEWSKEDENGLGDALWAIQQARTIAKDENDMGNLWYAETWLKSLRPQKQWKPSEKQIDALEHFVRSIGESGYASPCDNNTKLLYSLLEQLKKLREEKL